jgi:hypothetical protein
MDARTVSSKIHQTKTRHNTSVCRLYDDSVNPFWALGQIEKEFPIARGASKRGSIAPISKVHDQKGRTYATSLAFLVTLRKIARKTVIELFG